jgi:hypothetical protein
MALVHKGFSTYGPSAACVTAARLISGFTEVARRLSERRWLTLTNDLRDCENRSGWSTQAPGSLFDARYKGLTADAARIDAAICRQEHLR